MTNVAAAPPTAPGTILAEKYRVERILGQGGMGVVVEARHIALDERVALKFLLPDYAHHPEAAARFLREARAAVKIKSEHVARVSDVGTLASGAPYMVMEYLEGADLSKVLETSGVLPVSDAIDYVIQGCEAIAEAHGYGIVHRDIKPANLFLGKRPNGLAIVKVLDFGISKMADNSVDNLTKTTAAMGSALYMSPEQMQQTRGVDHRTDIYALGISLYELLAGRQPFYATTMTQLCAEIFTGTPTPIRDLRPEVPEGLSIVMERAYARDRIHRYQSVGEFVVALAPYAPVRAQAMIDSVAKMAGLEAPRAGQPATTSTHPGIGGGNGGTQIMPSSPPPQYPGPGAGRASSAQILGAAPPAMQTTGPAVSQLSDSSVKLPVQSRAGLYVVLALGIACVVSAGVVVGIRTKRATTNDATPATADKTGAVLAASGLTPSTAKTVAVEASAPPATGALPVAPPSVSVAVPPVASANPPLDTKPAVVTTRRGGPAARPVVHAPAAPVVVAPQPVQPARPVAGPRDPGF